MTSLKLCFHNDIRRMAPAALEELDFAQLRELVKTTFGIQTFVLKYNDDENDLVTLSGENDFAEAISISVAEKRKALRVRVITECETQANEAAVSAQQLIEEVLQGSFAPHAAFQKSHNLGQQPACPIGSILSCVGSLDQLAACMTKATATKDSVSEDGQDKAGGDILKSSGNPSLKATTSAPTSGEEQPLATETPLQIFEKVMSGQLAPEVAIRKGRTLWMEHMARASAEGRTCGSGPLGQSFSNVGEMGCGFDQQQQWVASDLDRAVAASMEEAASQSAVASSDGESKDGDAETDAEEALAAAIAESLSELDETTSKNNAQAADAEKAADSAQKATREAVLTKYAHQLRVLSSMGFCDEHKLLPLLEMHKGDILPILESLYD